MKICPQCGREYDLTMSFCLDDGSELLYGPATDEPKAAVMPGEVFRSGDVTAVLRKQEVPQPTTNSIAVLPFVHLSSQADDEFFCDGLAEELINALTKVESLKVAARTSAFSFKGTNKNISDIAQDLGVSKIVEGSVRKAGDRVRITIQLVNAADGYQIWSERYDREMKDIFAVQDEITLAVVEALKVKLLGTERVLVLKKATDDPEAYEFYLRGRALWNRRTPADLHKAIANFEKAIEIDPEYSLAYSGLADSYTLLTYFEEYAPHELRERTRECAGRAVELDDSSAEAHTAMALYRLIYEFDLRAADRHFEKALELNPRLVTAQYLYGTHLATELHFDEAVEHGRIALELDPLNQALNGNIARVLYFIGRYDDAIDLANKNLELAPNFFFLHWALGVCYRQKGNFEKAIDHLQKAVSFSGLVALKGDLGVACALAGREAEAREVLGELDARAKDNYVSPQWPAVIYAALGDKEKALEHLEKAWEVRAVQLLWLRVDPNFAPLRSEPKFIEILQKSGIAAVS